LSSDSTKGDSEEEDALYAKTTRSLWCGEEGIAKKLSGSTASASDPFDAAWSVDKISIKIRKKCQRTEISSKRCVTPFFENSIARHSSIPRPADILRRLSPPWRKRRLEPLVAI